MLGCPIAEGGTAENCNQRARGDDPCKGCKVKAYLDYQPKYKKTIYAAMLAGTVENFSIKPADLTWFDHDLLMIYYNARTQYLDGLRDKRGNDG